MRRARRRDRGRHGDRLAPATRTWSADGRRASRPRETGGGRPACRRASGDGYISPPRRRSVRASVAVTDSITAQQRVPGALGARGEGPGPSMTSAAASGRSRPSSRSSTVDNGSTPSLRPTMKTCVGADAHRTTDVGDRHRAGGSRRAVAPGYRATCRRSGASSAWRRARQPRRDRARPARRRFVRHDQRRCAATPGRRPMLARARSARRCARRGAHPAPWPPLPTWMARCRRRDCVCSRSTSESRRASASASAISRRVAEHRGLRTTNAAVGQGWLRQAAASARAQSSTVTRPRRRHNDVHWPTRRGAPNSPIAYSGATDSSRNTFGRSHPPMTPSRRCRST